MMGGMEVDGLFAETHAALDALAAVDLSSCDRAALDRVLAHWTKVRGFCDVYEVRIARRARVLAGQGRAKTPEGVLSRRGRRPAREARGVVERERACDQLPAFERALADGSVSGGHVDGLAAATDGLDDAAKERFAAHGDELLAQAKWQPVEAFSRECCELARVVSADEGESLLASQKRRCRVRRWVDRMTGMHHIHAELDPETGAKAWAAITAMTDAMRRSAANRRRPTGDPATATNPASETHDTAAAGDDDGQDNRSDGFGDAQAPADPRADASSTSPTLFDDGADLDVVRTDAATSRPAGDEATRGADRDAGSPPPTPSWEQSAAEAFVELLTGARTLDPRVPEVTVHLDWITLVSGLHEHSLCETSDGTLLPPSTVRRLCCRAEIVPVVLGGAGEALDVGRARRLATRAQRRALRAMHRTCAHPDCDVDFDRCEIHHVIPWERGGSTDLDNLAPLCPQHHHLVHEGGWSLRLDAHRTITLIRPDGTVHHTGTTVDRSRPASTGQRPDAPPGRRRTAA